MSSYFSGCTNLVSLENIPASVKNIQNCFNGCTALEGVWLKCDYNSTEIGGLPAFKDAFKDYGALKDGGIKVPSGWLTTYQAEALTMGTVAAKFKGDGTTPPHLP